MAFFLFSDLALARFFFEGFKFDIKSDMAEFKSEIVAEIAGIRASQSDLRSDITKWGVALFAGSILAMTSVISVFLASVV